MIAPDKMRANPTSKKIEIPSLYEALCDIPDPRERQGRRHPLPSMLAVACVALLCGYRSPYAISEWVANYGHRYLRTFKFTRPKPPGQATWYRVLGVIDREALEMRLVEWAQGLLKALGYDEAQLLGIGIDGKALRGSKQQGATDTHLLSAVAHGLGITLGQLAVPDKTNEIGAIVDLLGMLIIKGCVITTDALLTQVKVAQTILAREGDYVFIVKENQKTLYEDIQLLFESPPPLLRGQSWPQSETTNKRHGRLEIRSLTAATTLNDYLTWPGVQQVFQVTRTVTRQGKTTTEVVYGVTSLTPEEASAARLLTFTREHWHIENKSHWVRDVTFDEDRSQVRRGNLPHVMAALRNAVISLLRTAGIKNIAQALRKFAAQPDKAVALVGIPGE
jgi:predicted transposase YbfD/YdcC